MLFATPIFLGNFDSVRIAETDFPQLRRRLHSALLYGRGVVVNAASLLDNAYAVDLFDSDRFRRHFNFCAALHECRPLLRIRGIKELSFSARYDNLPDNFSFSSLGGKTKADVRKSGKDLQIRGRLERLDRLLEVDGVFLEGLPDDAGGRRDMAGFVAKTLRSHLEQGRCINVNVGGECQRLTPQHLLDEGLGEFKSRSEAYAKVKCILAKWAPAEMSRVDIAKLEKNIKEAYIDPAYHGLFVVKGEAILDGEFNWLSDTAEVMLVAENRVQRYLRGGLQRLRRDYPSLARMLPHVPWLLSRTIFIGKFLSGAAAQDLLLPMALGEIVKNRGKLVWARGWVYAYDQLQRKLGVQSFCEYAPVEVRRFENNNARSGVERIARLVMLPVIAKDVCEVVDLYGNFINQAVPKEEDFMESFSFEVLPKVEGNEHENSEVIEEYANPWFRVVRKGQQHWVDEPNAKSGAVVVAVLNDGSLVFVELFRHAQGLICKELPRGYGKPGEDSIDCALRELEEETGIKAAREDCCVIGRVQPNSAVLSSSVDVVMVQARQGVENSRAGEEVQMVVALTSAQFAAEMVSGVVCDGFSMAAYALMVAGGHFQN
ncbi:MAG TPA: NUDIX hydrolase [Magnetospirillum sp.]|nr:NUDIX hydrolase [Magnetospirillum sp.]